MGGQRLLMAAEADRKPLTPDEKKLFFDRSKEVRKNIITFEAEFKEERSVPSLKKPFLFNGRLFYHQNGLFFMEYIQLQCPQSAQHQAYLSAPGLLQSEKYNLPLPAMGQ